MVFIPNITTIHAITIGNTSKYSALKKISLMAYNAEKNLKPLYEGKKNFNTIEV